MFSCHIPLKLRQYRLQTSLSRLQTFQFFLSCISTLKRSNNATPFQWIIHGLLFKVVDRDNVNIFGVIRILRLFSSLSTSTTAAMQMLIFCCCVVVLHSRYTSMVMSGRSVKLTTLFLGRLRPTKRLTSTSCTYFRQ